MKKVQKFSLIKSLKSHVLFYKISLSLGLICTALLCEVNAATLAEVDKCNAAVKTMQQAYDGISARLTMMAVDDANAVPYTLIHTKKLGDGYAYWENLNGESIGYAVKDNRGFDFNNDRAYLGPLSWHPTNIWDRVFSVNQNFEGFNCILAGRTRLLGHQVLVLRLVPQDGERYTYVLSGNIEDGMPLELLVLNPDTSPAYKISVLGMESFNAWNFPFADELFSRFSTLNHKNNLNAWPELVIPSSFRIIDEGEHVMDEEHVVPYQVFSDGLTRFRVYRNMASEVNFPAVTDTTLSVYIKSGRVYEYAVVGEIPLKSAEQILLKVR